jgi:hypothetical protein
MFPSSDGSASIGFADPVSRVTHRMPARHDRQDATRGSAGTSRRPPAAGAHAAVDDAAAPDLRASGEHHVSVGVVARPVHRAHPAAARRGGIWHRHVRTSSRSGVK